MLNRLILESVVHFMAVHLSLVDWPFSFFLVGFMLITTFFLISFSKFCLV